MPDNDRTAYMVRIGPPAKGDVIHRSTCRYAQRPEAGRWLWADRQGFDNIDWEALRRHGIKQCQVCLPELLADAR